MDGRCWQSRLELEGAPRVIEAVWVGEANVSPSSAVLRLAGLHPEEVLWDSCLNGDGQTAHAAGCPGESGGIHPEGDEAAATTMAETAPLEGTGER